MADHNDMRSQTTGWRRWILAASLLFNIFLVTIIAGRALHARLDPPGARTMLAAVLSNAQSVLPPNDAEAFVSVMRREAPRFQEAAAGLAKARLEIESQIGAETFDKQATREALQNWREKWVQFFDEFRGPLVESLANVSPEGRRRLISDPDGRGPFLARNGR